MTQQELTSIVEAVISALLTSGKTLLQLTTVDEISENDFIELDGGRKVSYATLRDGIVSSNPTTGEAVDYDDRDEITSLSFNGNNGNISIKQRGRTQQTLTIPLATSLKRGLMSDTDLNKLNYSYNKIAEILAALDDKVSNATMTQLYETYLVRKVQRKYRAVPVEEGFVTLMSMGSVLDNIDGGNWTYTHAEGDAWWDPTNNKVYYWWEGTLGGGSYYNPSTEVVYYNNHTGRAYRWTGSEMQEMFVLLGSTGRVSEANMPPSVLASMGESIDNAGNDSPIAWIFQPTVGSYYYDTSSGSIKYYGAGGTVDLGAPSKTMIYCNAHTNLLYRWNGYEWVYLRDGLIYNYIVQHDVKKPDVLYQTDGTTGILGVNNNTLGENWQLTDLDFTPYKYLRCYIKAADLASNSNYLTPSMVIEIPLDNAAHGQGSDNNDMYMAGGTAVCPSDQNQVYSVLLAVDSTKTKLQFICQNRLYGTAKTSSNNNGRYLYKIEGCY